MMSHKDRLKLEADLARDNLRSAIAMDLQVVATILALVSGVTGLQVFGGLFAALRVLVYVVAFFAIGAHERGED